MSCHRSSRETGISDREGSGIVVRGSPIRKCPGVRADKSSGSSERTGVKYCFDLDEKSIKVFKC